MIRSLSRFKNVFYLANKELVDRSCSPSYSLLGPKMYIFAFKNIVTNEKI